MHGKNHLFKMHLNLFKMHGKSCEMFHNRLMKIVFNISDMKNVPIMLPFVIKYFLAECIN